MDVVQQLMAARMWHIMELAVLAAHAAAPHPCLMTGIMCHSSIGEPRAMQGQPMRPAWRTCRPLGGRHWQQPACQGRAAAAAPWVRFCGPWRPSKEFLSSIKYDLRGRLQIEAIGFLFWWVDSVELQGAGLRMMALAEQELGGSAFTSGMLVWRPSFEAAIYELQE